MKSFNLTEWALGHRAIVVFLILAIAIAGTLSFTRLGQLEDPELLRAVDDGDGPLAGRDRAAGAGRGAEPHGEEVRAARPLREGRDLRAPGLRRHDDQRERRHVQGGPARGLVPGAQEVQRHPARASRRRDRPDLQRRVRRRVGAALRRERRRRRPRRALRRHRRHQAAAAQGADGEEGRRLRQAGEEGVRGVLAPAPRGARHHAAAIADSLRNQNSVRRERLDRHAGRPRPGARDRPVRRPRTTSATCRSWPAAARSSSATSRPSRADSRIRRATPCATTASRC